MASKTKPRELERVIIGEFQWTQSSLFPDFDWRIVKWAKLSWAEPPAGRRKHSSTFLLSSALQSTMCSQHKLQSIMWLCSQQIAVYFVLQSTQCAIYNVQCAALQKWGEADSPPGEKEARQREEASQGTALALSAILHFSASGAAIKMTRCTTR